MPPKRKVLGKFKKIKNKQKGKIRGSHRLIKIYSFAQLEALIHQARRARKKSLVHHFQTLYRTKEKNWANALLAGQQKLLARQQAWHAKKAARIRVQQAQAHSRHQRQTRLREIYDYFRRELNKLDKAKHPHYFTPYLDLEPRLAVYVKKLQKKHPEYDPWKEFGRRRTAYRLNQGGQRYLIQQTQQAYQEEMADKESQLRYYKDQMGSLSPTTQEFLKTESFKYFFPEKGEHAEFFKRVKKFKQELTTIKVEFTGQRVKNLDQVLTIYQRLYQTSPWRLRDRLVVPTTHPTQSYGMGDLWNKYYTNNPFSATKKHYYRAVQKFLSRTEPYGELVPDQEIDLDRYGKPKFKAGQVIVLDSTKPGRRWSVYQNVPSLAQIIKQDIHEPAQEGYIQSEGTALEIQTWKLKKDKALCWVEAAGLGSCQTQVGTSNWWCLFCVAWGPYHPPVLPKHCPWLYTYKTGLCGSKQHSDANKQWHFSVEGERIRDTIQGGDWGSCHIGTFDKKRLKKQKRK